MNVNAVKNWFVLNKEEILKKTLIVAGVVGVGALAAVVIKKYDQAYSEEMEQPADGVSDVVIPEA
jgi:hypothetical protein